MSTQLPSSIGVLKLMSDSTTKTCTKCGQTFPATTEYFNLMKNAQDGLQAWCKKCNREYQRQYYQANTDEKREYQQAHVDRKREYDRQYRQINAIKIRKYLEINADELRDKKRKYQQANLDKKRVYDARRAARKRSLPDTFTHEQWIACLEYHNYCCPACGKQLRDLFGQVEPHADHWIPLASDKCPGTIATNMICLCSSCNHSKKDKMPDVWLKNKYGTRKANEILKRVNDYFEFISNQKL